MRLIPTLKRKPVDDQSMIRQSMISQATAIAAPIPLSPQRQTSRSFTIAEVPLPQAVAFPATDEDGVAHMAVAGRTRNTNDDTMEVAGRTHDNNNHTSCVERERPNRFFWFFSIPRF
jgi:hypothetical protein